MTSLALPPFGVAYVQCFRLTLGSLDTGCGQPTLITGRAFDVAQPTVAAKRRNVEVRQIVDTKQVH